MLYSSGADEKMLHCNARKKTNTLSANFENGHSQYLRWTSSNVFGISIVRFNSCLLSAPDLTKRLVECLELLIKRKTATQNIS